MKISGQNDRFSVPTTSLRPCTRKLRGYRPTVGLARLIIISLRPPRLGSWREHLQSSRCAVCTSVGLFSSSSWLLENTRFQRSCSGKRPYMDLSLRPATPSAAHFSLFLALYSPLLIPLGLLHSTSSSFYSFPPPCPTTPFLPLVFSGYTHGKPR